MNPASTSPDPAPDTTWTRLMTIEVDQMQSGLLMATCSADRGCLVTGRSLADVLADVLKALDELHCADAGIVPFSANVPPDPRDAEIERLRSLLARALNQHEDENGTNEGYDEHWAEHARKVLGR